MSQSNRHRDGTRDAIEDCLLDQTWYHLEDEKRYVKDAEDSIWPGPVADETPVEWPGLQSSLLLLRV
jgi:hypothetical protein